MRIGIYIPVLQDKPTGLGVYIHEIVSRLIAKHGDCIIFTESPGCVPSWLAGVPVAGCRSAMIPSVQRSGFLKRLSRLAWLNVSGRSDFRRHQVDVFFSPIQEGAIFPSVPQVAVVHDLTPIRFSDAYSRFHVLFTRMYLPRVLRRSVKTIAISESTKRDVQHYFGHPSESIEVVSEGFERSLFFPPLPEEIAEVRRVYELPDRYFFYSGTFSRHKNLVTALRAFARVRHQFPGIAFVLTGRRDSGDFQQFLSVATELGIDGDIRMLGYVPRAHLHSLIGGSVAYVFPSLFEGFGLAPLEALACGAPVISSNAGSLPEVIGDGGFLLPPLDVDAWAAQMISVAQQSGNPDFRARQQERALSQAARFSWDVAVDEILEILAQAAPQT